MNITIIILKAYIEVLKSINYRMSKFAIIVQNDKSQWNDIKGVSYHYPNQYKKILTPGCKIIYYKGSLKDKEYKNTRLNTKPHYFGIGIIGNTKIDIESNKNRYCEILFYQEFKLPVSIKMNNEYLENIPDSKKTNYWRFGVREIDKYTYDKILSHAIIENDTDYYENIKTPSLSEYNKLVEADNLDNVTVSTSRKEQKFLRDNLFKNKSIDTCCICHNSYPIQFLTAAHIKKRSKATIEERKDFENIVAPMCNLGCDDLYERGYISVKDGVVISNSLKHATGDLKDYINKIINNKCLIWNESNKKYFEWHYQTPIKN